MMSRVVAESSDPGAANRAVDALLAAGIAPSQIAVTSATPIGHWNHLDTGRPGIVPWLVFAGAAVGGTCGYLLVTSTQKSYPIQTGGMAIVPWWTDGIITYELAMLSAILVTVLVLIIGGPLFRDRPAAAMTELSDALRIEVELHSSKMQRDVETILARFGFQQLEP